MITGIFGKPRSGKTTFLAQQVYKNEKKQAIKLRLQSILPFELWAKLLDFVIPTYDYIYSNEYVKNTIRYETYDLGLFKPEPNSLILIHEAGTYFNNRLSKQIPQHCTDFFAKHGHYHVDMMWDSQSVDVDKKLRNRTALLFTCRKFFGYSFFTRINYWIGVNNDNKALDELYSIAQGFFGTIFAFLTFGFKVIKRKKYYDYFDSFSQDLHLPKPAPDILWQDI